MSRAIITPGMLVITTKSIVSIASPRTGRVLGEAEDEGRVWLDLNTMGAHLPQMYRLEELEAVTPELCRQHDLCVECLGYGLKPPGENCPECRGSGSSKWYVDIQHDANGATAQVTQRPHDT